MPADVKAIFTGSELSKDPKRLNLFVFMLDQQGRLVHGFHGLPGGARGGDGRSDYAKEIPNGLAKLQLLTDKPTTKEGRALRVPDLKATGAGVPAGVRLFVRLNDEKDPFRSQMPVVEVVAMKAEEWQALALPEKAKEIEAATLKNWLVQLYPAGIRTADQSKPFTKISGSLKLEPAGADKAGRYTLLRGKIKLAKGDDRESTFEGTFQAVLTYGLAAPEVKSVRAVVEGDYLCRLRGTQRMPLVAAIESRPD
jgi:hypothetical protein